ncbi:MAG: NADH-quinone oxidoreductase subunit N [Chloroflexi bacterium]|nr:MAG: NADH-quinone oxidoreductase subunit N [Chloroflexota bacterium]MBA4374818.1 NADH-quinone oxidoreductase subunit N [Anaerolinea sp.]
MTLIDLYSILPAATLIVWALFLLLANFWFSKRQPVWTPILAGAGLLASLVVSIFFTGKPMAGFGGFILVDGFSNFLTPLFAVTGIFAIGLAYDYLRRMGIQRGEYYTLLLFSISGMMLMASAGDLIIVFLALELLSIPLYVLSGFAHPRVDSQESALKYFLLGTFASGFFLFGTSLVFGAARTTNLTDILAIVSSGEADTMLLLIGSALMLAGFGFKIAAVPFHSWTPDVYQGAPSPVAAFMSVGAKAAGFAALIRVFSMIFPSLAAELTPIFWALAALTMVVGNVVAIAQTNLKRMLAYSSIAHAGYLLMAFVPFGDAVTRSNSVASALFYLTVYALASLGAWAVLIGMEGEDNQGTEISDLAGLGKTSPLSAAAMTVFMLSFTGIPLTLGFWGKFYLFRTAIEGGFVTLAVIGLITSLASAFYYLRVVVKMYFQEGQPEFHWNFWTSSVAIFTALALVVFSFMPGSLFDLALRSMLTGS